MKTTNLRHAFALFAFCFAGTTASAGDQPVTFGFDASAGVEYDSNVALQDLDASSGEADTATVLDAGVDMTIAAGSNGTIRLGYDVSATAYQDFSEYDLTLHHVNLDLGRRGRWLDAGIAVDRFDGVLDGEDYVSYTQLSPSISRLFGTRLFLRGAYVTANKEYDGLSFRDADFDAIRVDTYWLLDGMDRYWSIGLRRSTENANDAELDFDAALLAIAYGHNFKLPSITLQVKAHLRYEQRDYLNVTQSIGSRRKDLRLRSGLSAILKFNEYVQLEADVELTNNTSNLATAELEKSTLGVKLAINF